MAEGIVLAVYAFQNSTSCCETVFRVSSATLTFTSLGLAMLPAQAVVLGDIARPSHSTILARLPASEDEPLQTRCHWPPVASLLSKRQ
jgi:hypothetical protein